MMNSLILTFCPGETDKFLKLCIKETCAKISNFHSVPTVWLSLWDRNFFIINNSDLIA